VGLGVTDWLLVLEALRVSEPLGVPEGLPEGLLPKDREEVGLWLWLEVMLLL
jgi:hypothetical protein